MESPLGKMFTQQFTASIAPFRKHLAASGQKTFAIVDKPQRRQLLQQRRAQIKRIPRLGEGGDGT